MVTEYREYRRQTDLLVSFDPPITKTEQVVLRGNRGKTVRRSAAASSL
jgi:hypothetical protein